MKELFRGRGAEQIRRERQRIKWRRKQLKEQRREKKDEEVECEKILNRQIEELRGRTRQIEGRYCESEREIEEDNEQKIGYKERQRMDIKPHSMRGGGGERAKALASEPDQLISRGYKGSINLINSLLSYFLSCTFNCQMAVLGVIIRLVRMQICVYILQRGTRNRDNPSFPTLLRNKGNLHKKEIRKKEFYVKWEEKGICLYLFFQVLIYLCSHFLNVCIEYIHKHRMTQSQSEHG